MRFCIFRKSIAAGWLLSVLQLCDHHPALTTPPTSHLGDVLCPTLGILGGPAYAGLGHTHQGKVC